MTPPAGRRIVLGICGGIAAYKVVEVCRQLVDGGAHVVPVMTSDAHRFVGEGTFSALASERVQTSLWSEDDPIPHTHLGQGADLVLVAPATANLIARYAAGMADDLLTATLLATRAPVILCPAMHTEMWEHPAVQDNIATLRARGVQFVGPDSGHLAGGDVGEGRLAGTQAIVAGVNAVLSPQDLTGYKVLVTAGGTREPIDAVRFVGNRSSGKQGYALAVEASARGADVTLVTTVDPPPAQNSVDVVSVRTAGEMAEAVLARAHQADVVIMAAAVADFRPASVAEGKLAKADGVPTIVLEPTVDILSRLGSQKSPGQVLVGFAAEPGGDLGGRAGAKLAEKNLDMIVANDVSSADAGFDIDTNRAMIIHADGTTEQVPLVSKREMARFVIDAVASQFPDPGRKA